MRLTEEQKETIKKEWGERADDILSQFKKKKGKLPIFNDDGSLKVTKEEVEKKLNKQPKKKLMLDREEEDILHILWKVKRKLPSITTKDEAMKISKRLDELKYDLAGVIEKINQERLLSLAQEIESMPEDDKKKLLGLLGILS